MRQRAYRLQDSGTMQCPLCYSMLSSEHAIGSSYYCRCGWYGAKDFERRRRIERAMRWFWRGMLVASIALGVFMVQQWRIFGPFTANYLVSQSKILFGLGGQKDWWEVGVICNTVGRPACSEKAYSHLMSLDDDPVFAANLAMAQTKLRKYESAVKHFERVHAGGLATYDSMVGHADALAGLGRESEAISWYYRSLDVKPNLVEVAGRLVDLLAKREEYDEALSLIANLSFYVPEVEDYMKGRVHVLSEMAERESLKDGGKSKTGGGSQKMRLVSVLKHHFVPVRLPGRNEPFMFMVDTGATILTFNSSWLEGVKASDYRVLGPIELRTADDRTLYGERVRFRRLKVGPWSLDNVDAVVCDTCTPLAGKSLLSRFQMTTKTENGVEFLTLTR